MSNLFQDCLGDQYEQLAPLVRQAHDGTTRLEGDVAVERGNLPAQLICALFGMPPATPQCRLVVHGRHQNNVMNWNRHFDDFVMNSHFYKNGMHLVERLGPIHMSMALTVDDGVLRYELEKTRLFGVATPRWLSPKVTAIEQQTGDKYRFSVVVTLPLIGKLVSYCGDMQVETITD